MWSAAHYTTRSSACRVFDTCLGRMGVMLLMYRIKSVGEMSPTCGTPSLILTLSLMYPSSLTLADLSCRKQGIHLYILPDTRHCRTFSTRPSPYLVKRFCQIKEDCDNILLFWECILYLLGNKSKLIFRASVLLCFLFVTEHYCLLRRIAVFC